MCCPKLCSPAYLIVNSHCDIPVSCLARAEEPPSPPAALGWRRLVRACIELSVCCFDTVCDTDNSIYSGHFFRGLHHQQIYQLKFCDAGMPLGH